MQCPRQNIFFHSSQPDVSHAHPSPATGNRKENGREFFDKSCLLFRCELQVAVALFGGRKCGKNVAANAEVGLAHVRAFLSALKTQCDAAEVVWGHEWS